MPNSESVQSKGGKARKEALTQAQRSEIARQAAKKRWAAQPIKATHRGNFLVEFGIDVDCYVLSDDKKTAVLSSRGMGKALGLGSSGGNKLVTFLNTKSMAVFVGPAMRSKLSQPVKFQWGTGGLELPPTVVNGYDVTLLIDICQSIVNADNAGAIKNQRAANQARVILGASARSGIQGLVYALAGFNPSAEEVVGAFKVYVQEEARKYEKEFPPELYAQWYRLYSIPTISGRGRPWHFKHLTLKHVYEPLAKSSGKILQLTKALQKSSGADSKAKIFQFLNDIGTRALRFHLGRLVEMAEDSADLETYERKITSRFGDHRRLDLSRNVT